MLSVDCTTCNRSVPLYLLEKHHVDHIIDGVFYCGVNNVITLAGIVGNSILLVIFMRPHLIRHRSILHTYLKV